MFMRATWIWALDQTWKPQELQEQFDLKHSFNILESSDLAMPHYGKPQLEGRENSQNIVWQFTESQKNLDWRSSSQISCTKLSYLLCNHNTSTRKKILRHIYPTQWSLEVPQLLLYSHGPAIQFSFVGPDLKHWSDAWILCHSGISNAALSLYLGSLHESYLPYYSTTFDNQVCTGLKKSSAWTHLQITLKLVLKY